MPPRGSDAYLRAMSQTKDWRYDPRAAEEYSDAQRQFGDRQLTQLSQMGDINAAGIERMGDAAASIAPNVTQGYLHGRAFRREEDAHKLRTGLAEEQLRKDHAEDAFWDAPAEAPKRDEYVTAPTAEESAYSPGLTRRQLKSQLQLDKTQAEVDKLNRVPTDKSIEMTAYQKGLLGLQKERLGIERDKAQKVARGGAGSKVTSATAQEVGSFDSAMDMASQLEDQYNNGAASAGSSIKSLFKGTDADKYETFRDYAAQTIGTILEKGKLTDRDYDRYKEMLPKPNDTNGIAAQKVKTLKGLILAKKRGEIGGLTQAGFNTSGFDAVPDTASTTIGKKPGDTATAAPAMKAPEEMTPAERAAELRRLRGSR